MNKNKQFELLKNFASNMQSKHNGISNMYIFETTDEDGNVTDVKYGMNLMTNTGFNAVYKTGNAFALSESIHLYVGSGVSMFDKSTSYIETPLFGGLAATNETTSKDYAYPIIYLSGAQPDTGIITLVSCFGKVSYPTNITNYDSDTMISEYGIGTNYNSLWTHAHIYNDRGEMSSITKKKNEKLTIYIYMCLSMYEHVIMNCWANGVFPVLTTPALMFQRMYESNIKTYKRGNIQTTRSGSQHAWDDTSGTSIVNTTTAGSFTLWSQAGAEHGYIDGFIYDAPGCSIICPEYLPQKENFTLTGFTSSAITKSSGFSDNIGKNITDSNVYNKNLYPPFSTMSDLNVYTFNYHTGLWDNPCPFSNDDDMSYTNTGMETGYCKPIYYWSNGQIQTAYLYQNTDTTNAILSVNQGHEMLIACSKYWDQSTWITITNFNNIPVEARNCRYWISASSALGIIPNRTTQPFVLLDAPGGTDGYQTFPLNTFNIRRVGVFPSAANTSYNCLTVGRQICALNRNRSYTIGSTASYDTYNFDLMSYGKWLFLFDPVSNGTIYTIDVSGLNNNDPDLSVLTVTRSLGFSGNVNSYNQIYRSTNGNGIFTFQSLNSSVKETVVMTVNGNTITTTTYPWTRACCIYGTTKIAYIPASDESYIHIYDTTYAADIGTIPLSISISAMFGNANHLWFYNGSYTYHVDISSTPYTTESCNSIFITNQSESYKIKTSCVNDVTMVYNARSNDRTMAQVFYVTHDAPTDVRNMSPFNADASTSPEIFNCELKYLNNHTLVAIVNMSQTTIIGAIYVCDLGRYIKTGTVSKRVIDKYVTEFAGMYFYGENVFYDGQFFFPAVNCIPITVTGKTKTITTFNYTKSVSDKPFNLSFTNTPLWGHDVNDGKPPGHPAPILNGDGKIIGWS